jgi:hypothetical protein
MDLDVAILALWNLEMETTNNLESSKLGNNNYFMENFTPKKTLAMARQKNKINC